MDDEVSILEAFQRNLDDEFQIYLARDTRAALDVLEQTPIDVVVSDERMPGAPGSELVSHVCARWPHVVRILLTGKPDVASAQRATSEGRVFKFLQKPCPVHEVARVIRRGLVKRSLLSVHDLTETGMPASEAEQLIETLVAHERDR